MAFLTPMTMEERKELRELLGVHPVPVTLQAGATNIMARLLESLDVADDDITAYKRSLEYANIAVISVIGDRTELSADEIVEIFKSTRAAKTTCRHCGIMLPEDDDEVKAHAATCPQHPAVIRAERVERVVLAELNALQAQAEVIFLMGDLLEKHNIEPALDILQSLKRLNEAEEHLTALNAWLDETQGGAL